MGRKSNWLCTNAECNFEVRTVSGGLDRGFHHKTQTRFCTNCKPVKDYDIGFASDPSHQTFSAEEIAAHDNPSPKCAECGGKTAPWERICTQCGSEMERDSCWIIFWD